MTSYIAAANRKKQAQHAGRPTPEGSSARPQKRHKSAAPGSPSPEPGLSDQMEDDRVSDNDYDYEYEDDEDFEDDNMEADSGGAGGARAGAGAGSGKGAGGAASSSAEAEVDLALRDETVAFIDQAQLKVLMSKVVNDIR